MLDERTRRHDRPLCILLADIDEFKAVNDRHGHDVGDKVLQETARTFSSCLRDEDLKEESTVIVSGESVRVTLSIGVAEERDRDPEEAIRSADQALLEAKRTGRNKVMLAPR
jgi:PleD family two-component response regulator